jgi:hypothetical protein
VREQEIRCSYTQMGIHKERPASVHVNQQVHLDLLPIRLTPPRKGRLFSIADQKTKAEARLAALPCPRRITGIAASADASERRPGWIASRSLDLLDAVLREKGNGLRDEEAGFSPGVSKRTLEAAVSARLIAHSAQPVKGAFRDFAVVHAQRFCVNAADQNNLGSSFDKRHLASKKAFSCPGVCGLRDRSMYIDTLTFLPIARPISSVTLQRRSYRALSDKYGEEITTRVLALSRAGRSTERCPSSVSIRSIRSGSGAAATKSGSSTVGS